MSADKKIEKKLSLLEKKINQLELKHNSFYQSWMGNLRCSASLHGRSATKTYVNIVALGSLIFNIIFVVILVFLLK